MVRPNDLYEEWAAAGRLSADPAQRAVLPVLDRLASGLDRRPAGRRWFGRARAEPGAGGIYLWGAVGRGKSMLVDLLVAAVASDRVRRVHFHAFMQQVQAGLTEARRDGRSDAVRPVAERIAKEARLLALDELEITDIADAMIIGRLFQILLARGVRVIVTSNQAPEALYPDGLNRDLLLPFIALIRRELQVIELGGPRDWRREREPGASAWFAPADGAAAGAMDRCWRQLAGAGPQAPLDLVVHGRRLRLGRASGRAARIDFTALCEAPLGPADYIALAARVDVLLVDDIPLIGPQGESGRRFITLVDALYEAGVRLIASAADWPDRLCRADRDAFAFRRTASRLAEMQAADWGKRSCRAMIPSGRDNDGA